MVKLYDNFCNDATAWISASQPGFRRTSLGVKREIVKWIHKKLEIPRRISKFRKWHGEFLSGNSQHLNNLCALPKLAFLLFCWVSVNSYFYVIFSFITYVFVSSFLQTRLTGSDRKAALLPKFLVCKRFYREGLHGIWKIILRAPPKKILVNNGM